MTSDKVIESYFRHGTGQNSRFVFGHNESVAIPAQEADDMPQHGQKGGERGQHNMLNTQAHPKRHDTASGNTTRLRSI